MMSIGFPSQPGVEQNYSLSPSQKDLEFEIRDRGEAGWGLYDEQAKEWLTVVARSGGREEVRAIGVRRDDAFSRMMAGVVHDTAVLYNDYSNSELATAPTSMGAGNPTAANTTAAPSPSAANSTAATLSAADSAPANSSATNSAAVRTDTTAARILPIDTPVIKPEAVADLANRTDIDSHRPDTIVRVNSTLPPSALNAPFAPNAATTSNAATARNAATGLNEAASLKAATALNADAAAAATISRTPGNKLLPSADSSVREPLYGPMSSVVKLSERKLSHSMRLVYAAQGKDAGAKSDTVVVIIPLDNPQRVAARPNGTASVSSRTAASKAGNTSLDSTRTSAAKARLDSTPAAAAKPRVLPPDSGHSAASKARNTSLDSPRTSAAKNRLADSAPSASRSKGPNYDSPSNPRLTVPGPGAQTADKPRPNDSVKKPATKSPLPYINSDCHAFATDYDVDKLRVKMLEAEKDEDRIAAALKVFKVKCFRTRQVKALSEVFTADASKYRFFETAYPFAADEHFRELGALITDPVYASKFKNLVH